jgi:arylsulfatase
MPEVGLRPIRMDNWKVSFMEQRTPGGLDVWKEPFVRLRAPNLYNLRTDPCEFAKITANTYSDWMFHHAYLIYPVQAIAAQFAATFSDFPAVQKPNSFTIDDAMAKMSEAGGAG